MSVPDAPTVKMSAWQTALPLSPTWPMSWWSQGEGRGGVGTMVLIHCATSPTALVSTRFRARGGILFVCVALIRKCRIDCETLLIATTFAFGIPYVLFTRPLMIPWLGSGVS